MIVLMRPISMILKHCDISPVLAGATSIFIVAPLPTPRKLLYSYCSNPKRLQRQYRQEKEGGKVLHSPLNYTIFQPLFSLAH